MPQHPTFLRAASVLSLAAALLAGPAHAGVVMDPSGDFLPTYTGPRAGDLDVIQTGASLNNGTYVFVASFAAAIGTTPGALYVFGIDRGQGTARFAAIGSAVVFDAVVSVTQAGVGTVRDLLTSVSTPLASGAVQIKGVNFEAYVPAALLPSAGFATNRYTFNLWPRSGSGNNNQISDFAPDNSNALVDVPEPASWALLGLVVLAVAARRQHGRRTA